MTKPHFLEATPLLTRIDHLVPSFRAILIAPSDLLFRQTLTSRIHPACSARRDTHMPTSQVEDFVNCTYATLHNDYARSNAGAPTAGQLRTRGMSSEIVTTRSTNTCRTIVTTRSAGEGNWSQRTLCTWALTTSIRLLGTTRIGSRRHLIAAHRTRRAYGYCAKQGGQWMPRT